VATTPLTTDAVPVSARRRRRVAGFVALTKPRIIELLLVTTVPVMFLAEGGVPSLRLVAATLLGGILSAGAANTFNSVYDRDIDRLMHRTSNRPMVTGEITVREGLTFGAVLTVVSTVWFAVAVNLVSAALSLLAIALYAVGYTMLLKRRTSQNIVWGGIAGCMPTLIGWSAVTGTVGWHAVVLFLVIFFWTPPHYWPLSMAFRDDYASAEVPMLPVERGPVAVGRQIVAYAWLMVAVSLVLVPVASMGWVYLATAVLSGALFVAEAHRLLHGGMAAAPPLAWALAHGLSPADVPAAPGGDLFDLVGAEDLPADAELVDARGHLRADHLRWLEEPSHLVAWARAAQPGAAQRLYVLGATGVLSRWEPSTATGALTLRPMGSVGGFGAVAHHRQGRRPEPARQVPCRAGDELPDDGVGLAEAPQHAETHPGRAIRGILAEIGQRKQAGNDAVKHPLPPPCLRRPSHRRPRRHRADSRPRDVAWLAPLP